MDIRKIALGLGAFVGGTAALTGAAVALRRYKPQTPSQPKTDGHGDAAQPANEPANEPANTPATPLATAAADGPAPSLEQARDPAPTGDEGHAAADLAGDAPVTLQSRAPDAFRPDMDAPMTPAEREALRPATGPSPTLVDAGTSLPSS